MARLVLSDGTTFEGESFGAAVDSDGEVVFTTGMVGYPESLTDPSYRGQILTFTYPLIGNYGVPSNIKNAWGFSENFESEEVHVRGVVTAQVSDDYSHHTAVSSLHRFLEHHKVPGITGVDTRALTKKLREHGVMLGRIVQGNEKLKVESLKLKDPNEENLVAEVSCKEPITYQPNNSELSTLNSQLAIVCYDCGIKRNILRSWLKRGVTVHRVPWNFNLATCNLAYDAVFISNGPGDPKKCVATIESIKWAIGREIPVFGICLGNQLLALAIGGDTYKLKYGHRGANQPCICEESKDAKDAKDSKESFSSASSDSSTASTPSHRCIITSQNHGFAVDEKSLPKGWHVWFRNANDGTIEGIRHVSGKFISVQFHPEATPGPEDANYLFDEFLHVLERERGLVGARK